MSIIGRLSSWKASVRLTFEIARLALCLKGNAKGVDTVRIKYLDYSHTKAFI